MLDRVVSVTAADDFKLRVTFEDGVGGEVDMRALVGVGVFAPLAERDYFARVAIDEFGALAWPNGADLAPDAMHEALAAQGFWRPGEEPMAA